MQLMQWKVLDQARVYIEAGQDEQQQVYIRVSDNGKGIEASVLEKIFIPIFYN